MARAPQVTLIFGDDEYPFRLNIKQVEELQEKCDAGPSQIMRRLMQDEWRVADVREPIRLGLIGGGMDAEKALRLTRRYVDDSPFAPLVLTALAILQARLYPFEDEPVGKAEPAAAQSEPTPAMMNESTSPASTGSAPSWDSLPAT